MIEIWKPPKPKFNINDIVEFTNDNKEKYLLGDNSFLLKYTGIQFKKFGSSPYANMYIQSNYKWDKKNKKWIYSLRYGKNLDIYCFAYENDIKHLNVQ